ncbi:MAG: hypothetical protein ACFCVB_19970 [Nodosilinea sp.]
MEFLQALLPSASLLRLKSYTSPSQLEQQEMVKAVFTPAHTNTIKPLLNEPFAGTFHHS